MTYTDVKAKKIAGEKLTIAELDAAIANQLVVVAGATNSFAKHLAKLGVADRHPFPLDDDQEGRVGRRYVTFNHEFARLARLHSWRELIAQGVTA